MRQWGVFLGLCGALMPGVGGMARAQAPSFTLVGFPSGASASYAHSLSADGGVAAGYSRMGNAYPGFTWTAAGGRYDFGLDLGMPPTTQAAGISGNGGTVVGAAWTTQNFFSERAFRWSGPGTYQSLGTAGYPRSAAESVSGDGSVVVGRVEGGPFTDFQFGQAFRWTPATGMQLLGHTRPGNVYSRATDVSRDGGTIVGYSFDSGGFNDAFMWTPAGGMATLPQLPGTPFPNSRAYGVTFDGSIIVGISGPANNAVMWRGGSVIDLGLPPGWTYSIARAVSDNGAVVAASINATVGQAAGVWTAGRGMEPLADFLTANGASIPMGWNLLDSYDVSGNGLVFAGVATSAGSSQGFIASVPGPATVAVGVLGLASTAARRRATA